MTVSKFDCLNRFIVADSSFYRRALLLVLPVVLQNIINHGVNMMDTVMIGQLGEAAISASSLANQFYQIFNFLCMGISAAGLVLASQYWGANDKQTVKHVYDLCMQLVAAIGLGFSVVSMIFPEQIMAIYISDSEVIQEGAKYLRVTAFIYLPHGLSLVMANIVRSIGNAKLGLIVSCLSFIINIGANYVFIFGKLGMPAMGVMGAAIGTLCARIVEFTVCVVYMLKVEKNLKYNFAGLLRLPAKALLKEFQRLGFPAIISDTILGLAASAMSIVLGCMGKEVVSAYAIVTVLDRMCNVATMGLSSAAAVMIGHTVGSGDFKRAQKEGWSFLAVSMGFGLLASVLVLAVGILSVDLYEITPDTRLIAISMMRASAIVVFFQSIQSALSKGILRGGGDTKFLMVADVIFQWCVSIPLGYLVGVVWKLPAFWVLIALRIDYIIKVFWLAFRLKNGKWIHKAQDMRGSP